MTAETRRQTGPGTVPAPSADGLVGVRESFNDSIGQAHQKLGAIEGGEKMSLIHYAFNFYFLKNRTGALLLYNLNIRNLESRLQHDA